MTCVFVLQFNIRVKLWNMSRRGNIFSNIYSHFFKTYNTNWVSVGKLKKNIYLRALKLMMLNKSVPDPFKHLSANTSAPENANCICPTIT